MQPARAAVAPGVPAYLVTRPSPGNRDVVREALLARLTGALDEHRFCAVLAPAGHGKTSLLAAWVGRAEGPVGWLSLTSADRHPEHLARGLAAAVAELEASAGSAPVLVIDDVHLADEVTARAVLRPFVEAPPPGVRLVLAGRHDPGLGLPRLLAAGDLAVLTADDLSFTADEVRAVARAVGTDLSPARAAALQGLTRGWPVAVRLALLSPSTADVPIEPAPTGQIPQLPDYLLESVLADLPAALVDFVLQACVCDWLTASLVDDLLQRTDGAARLEQALAAGLPLERREAAGAEPVYRWHPLMATSGRALLQRRDPLRLRELEVRAARALAAHDPVEAAAHALTGRDPELASALVRSQWLAAVLRGDSALVEELCGRLPAPYSDDPEVLAIRAACLRNANDAARATDLDRRARDRAGPGTEPRMLDLTVALARLFVLDSGDELAAESERARALLAQVSDANGPLRACALLLIGWTELRLRHAPTAIALLREAAAACRAEGLDDLAGRARANECFALAFSGDFRSALDLVASGTPEQEPEAWRRADGAIEWFTTGWIRFWTGDAAAATDAFQHACDRGGGLVSYADLARCWLIDAAVDTGDRRRVEQVVAQLDLVPDTTIQGLDWPMYKATARAGAALLAGRPGFAVHVLDDVVQGDAGLPAANLLAAEVYWLCGRDEQALALTRLLRDGLPAYLRAGALVIDALHLHREGDHEGAHRLLESALAASAAQRLMRPFLLGDAALTELLAEHPAWGTRHENLVATALTQRSRRTVGPAEELTARERQVLGQLSTTLDIVEIAAELYISPNTLKTHLKSIYRKLGVASRREAVRASRQEGAAGVSAPRS